MNKDDLYIDGVRLRLGRRIGKGGEGEVYLTEDIPGLAVKLYTGKDNSTREAKVEAMVNAELSSQASLVAFPKALVRNPRAEFFGFSMNVVNDHHPLHELYSVKSRKIMYPDVDFRFLTRAAANMTRAIAQVHSSSCVIGDLNHSGVLISKKATVALIDADSFQFNYNQNTYPCLVGVPEYTPPELQGKRLDGVSRHVIHDYFGMAVAIFHLLFMGRHPYAGRYAGGDLTLDQAIKKNLFAYSKLHSRGMTPPPATLPLDFLPGPLAMAFENAFGPNPDLRPTAAQWIDYLTDLEADLNHCNVVSSHYYPSKSITCPWCKLENASGTILFLSGNNFKNFGAIPSQQAIEQILNEIARIVIPDLGQINPRLANINNVDVSAEARAAKVAGIGPKLLWWLLLICAVGAMFLLPQGFIVWIAVVAYAWNAANETSLPRQKWIDQYKEAEDRYLNAVEQWQSQMGLSRLINLKTELKNIGDELRSLPKVKEAELNRYKNDRYNIHLNIYLDRFLLRDADIPGIARGKKVTLVAYGIESAADVSAGKVMSIPGFGEATTAKLLAWREACRKGFQYNSTPGTSDIQAQAKIDREFVVKTNSMFDALRKGYEDLSRSWSLVSIRLQQEVSHLSSLHLEMIKAERDLEFLSIPKPHRSKFSINQNYKIYTPTNNAPSTTSNNACPNCGSSMVRRTAKRGRTRGSSFWGCSRYPRCKGTRP